MHIHTSGRPGGGTGNRSDRGRLWLRSLGAVVALFALVGVGAVVGPAGSASAAGPTWAGAGVTLPSNIGPGHVFELQSTQCPAPGNCVAVGDYQTGTGQQEGLIEIEHAGSWTAAEAPLPGDAAANPEVGLFNVSCPTAGSCVVVGFYRSTGGDEHGMVLTQQGSSWSAITAPVPHGVVSTGSYMFSVSCFAPGSCAATGIYDNSSDQAQGLLLVGHDGSWQATQAPLPAGAAANLPAELISVSCGGPAECVAVGIYDNGVDEEQGLIERLTGDTWAPVNAVSPVAGVEAILESVSCATASFCTAVGADGVGSNEQPLANTVTPGAVTAPSVPLPANARTSGSDTEAALLSVSCPTATYCVSVGGYTSTAGSGIVPLVETYSGATWRPATLSGTALDPSATSALYGVSCSWPGSCTAAGISEVSGPTHAEGLVETLAAGTWTQSTAILPSNSKVPPEVELGVGEDDLSQPVSCVGGVCVLVGSYETTAAAAAGFFNTYPNLSGYQLAASDGGVFAFNAPFYGSTGNLVLNEPVVGMAEVPDTGGYYEAASDGGVFAFHAPFYGSMGSTHLNAPIVGIAFDSRTGGYYEVASDGGVFAFHAPFYGSMGGAHLNKPVVGITFDPFTGGYLEVASDGGVFAFNAPFQGSTGSLTLNKPVVGMTMNLATGGYYEVASDGGIFAFNAPFQGSTGSLTLNKPVVGMTYDFLTGGYYEVASDGGIFAFNAPFQGSTGNITLNKPVVGMGFG